MGELVTRGLSPGMALPAPAVAAAQPGMVMNAAGLWVYPPGFLIAVDAGGAVGPHNSSSETTVLNAALTNSIIGGALPAFVAVGDAVHLRAWGTAVLGATGTLLFNVYGGATKIAAGTASGNYAAGAARGWLIDLWIHLLSSTTVSVSGLISPRGGTGAGFTTASDIQTGGNDSGVAVTVSTLPLAIDIKAQSSTATATDVLGKGATARYFPKGY